MLDLYVKLDEREFSSERNSLISEESKRGFLGIQTISVIPYIHQIDDVLVSWTVNGESIYICNAQGKMKT